jgi:hypothetical protein
MMIKRDGHWYFSEEEKEAQRKNRALMQESNQAVIEAARETERRERARRQNRSPANDSPPS